MPELIGYALLAYLAIALFATVGVSFIKKSDLDEANGVN